jgi:syntaxin 6
MFNRNGSNHNSYSKVDLDDRSDDGRNGRPDELVRNQQALLRQQDEGLDILSASVLRLGEMSLGISEELGQQNKMLESMETDLDEAGENLDLLTRSTKEFIKQAGGEKNCIIIVVLTVVALILFFLVLYA